MKKLIFTKGDETRPKFEDLTNAETYNSSIFSDVYDRAFSLIYEIANPPKQNNPEHNRERNNIIAFIGERGSGKTSCLKSIYHSLYKDNTKSLHHKVTDTKTTFNNILPIIDPSYFDEHSNIIEIVIAHMFKSFKDAVNKSNHSFDGDNMEKKRKLVKKFQEVKDALDCTKARDIRFNSNDSIEQLSKLASGSNLHDSMEKLVDCYLSYFKPENDNNPQMLVIAIDDLDVQTNHTYQMVEQIRKYLIIDNVLILMGVKLVQLSNLIKKKFLADFNDKDGDRDKGQEVDDMVARYLIKLLPLSHRLNLPNYNDMPEIELAISSLAVMDAHDGDNDSAAKINDDGENAQKSKHEQSDEIINLYETVLALIYKKTGLMFYNFNQEHLIVPHNLRELLNLIAMLNNMNDKENNKNRNIFKQYFIESWCLDRLTPQQYTFIKELNECDAVNINSYIINYLKRYVKNTYSIDIIGNTNKCDCSIATLNRCLNDSQINIDTSMRKFIFAIKTVYSMILHHKYDEIKDIDKLKSYTDSYFKFQTNGLSYKIVNKLNHIFDYEKMIGEDMIHIDNQVVYSHEECIDMSHIISYYTDIYNKIKPDVLGGEYNNNKTKGKITQLRFNAFELILLLVHKYDSYNITKLYYNSFPIEALPSTGKVKIRTSTLYYNVTRLVNLYRLYNEILRRYNAGYLEKVHDMELVKFFKVVDAFGDNSIIKQLIQRLSDVNNLAIVNIDMPELIREYLTVKNDNESNIVTSFKKLMSFKFFIYQLICQQHKKQNIFMFRALPREHSVNIDKEIEYRIERFMKFINKIGFVNILRAHE